MDEERNPEEEQKEEEEQDDDNDGCLCWSCDNCRESCVADNSDHAYSHHLCTGCSQRRCCKTCRHYLPDVCYDNEQQKTRRVSFFNFNLESVLLVLFEVTALSMVDLCDDCRK